MRLGDRALKLELHRKGRKCLSLYLGVGFVAWSWGLGFRILVQAVWEFKGTSINKDRNLLPLAPKPIYIPALAVPHPFLLLVACCGL